MQSAVALPDKSSKKRKRRNREEPAGAARAPWWTRERIALAALLTLAAALRIYRLMADYPVVSDESIYLRWGEIIEHQGQWFISLLDGKQPLSYWFYALERMIAPSADPLWMGRMTSVAAGVGTTALIFFIGRRLDGFAAGFAGALLYAVFPWAMMYDRLVYTEALVNVTGAALVWACLYAFDAEPRSPGRDALAGLAFGLGFWMKSTALLFAVVPLVIGIWKRRRQPADLAKSWATMAAAAAPFPLLSWVFKPVAPMFETASTVLHHTTFFVDPAEFLANPFTRFVQNAPRFGEYIPYLVSTPAAIGVVLSLGYLLWRRSVPGLIVALIGFTPLLVQCFVLTFMPTRYPYPHLWPALLLAGLATAELGRQIREKMAEPQAWRAAWAVFAVLLAGPMLVRTAFVLQDPKDNISPHDTGLYFGSYSHAGFGVAEAISYLRSEALRNGPMILLVDPIWSVPADAIFPYLNLKYGIHVYEAWWTQISPTHAIMPEAEVDLMRSHYERIPAGKLDFRTAKRVFYLTDTNYYTPEAVHVRQPTAQPVIRFLKPGGQHSIDIYRLK
ncbi:MAG: glycosyltransferase family 39 protein [Acidobacteria bacterium]|nr:glycosyltransferase family 39 protein [Acidobacteriota bacterium]